MLELGQSLARFRELLEERLLDDRDLRSRIGDDILDLLGRQRLVDRERHRPDRHRRQVGDKELRPVGEHESERVAPAEPERGEARRQPIDTRLQLIPGETRGIVERAHRDALTADLDDAAKRLAERRTFLHSIECRIPRSSRRSSRSH